MASIFDDYHSAVALVISEYQDLQRLNPKHELLGLLKNVDSKSFIKTREFVERYAPKDSREGLGREIQTLGKGYLEFKKAVTTELFEILRQEKRNIGKENKKTGKKLEKRLEEQGLIGMIRTHITHNQIPLERVLNLISP